MAWTSRFQFFGCSAISHKKIIWLGRARFNSSDAVRFLTVGKINSLLKYHTRICLFIFIGTCDFTCKGRRQIHLRKPVCNTLQVYYDNLLYIKRRCAGSRIRLTFLHIPYYSIRIWNKIKGHENADIFREDDKELSRIIDAVNSRIDDLNSDMNTYSPRLNADLVRSRKGKGKRQRYSMNFKLLVDGIHPGKQLARS